MKNLIEGMAKFASEIFPQQQNLYQNLAAEGQRPKTLMISCADSRVVPEQITQVGPGEIFVCRNAGNIVPPFAESIGGISAAIEYAVVGLGVHDIIICGHSGCGAMKAKLDPQSLDQMPSVRKWLRHADAAYAIVCEAYPNDMDGITQLHHLGLENVRTQLINLCTHPSVAARLAQGTIALHGWFFEIEVGRILALDDKTGKFIAISADMAEVPVAYPPKCRVVVGDNL